jgi:hypothetical protein
MGAKSTTAVAAAETSPAAAPASAQSALPDLSGVWAQKLVTSAVSDVSLIGEVVSQTIAINQVRIDQEGRELTVTATPCTVRLVSDQNMVKTHIPSTYVDAMEPKTRQATLEGEDGEFYLDVPGHTSVLGARLDGPDAKLPTEAGDPRVLDPDQDGHPGMTISISGLIDSQLYMVQKSWNEMRGRVLPGDRIAGEVNWRTKQVILDATSGMVGDSPDSTQHPNAEQSYFRMTRVGEDSTCSEIVQKRENLF